jgi:hypothetical protein
MSKKKGNNSSKKQQNNGAFSPIAIGLVKRAWPELLSNSVKGVDPLTPEERERWEKEWRKRWKEEHIDDIKHSGDFWEL